MKLLRPIFAFTIVASFAGMASAQSVVPADIRALDTLKKDLIAATASMRPCLPIYEGHRGTAETAVNQARVIVAAAIAAANPPVVEKPKAPAKEKAEKKTTPARPAVAANKPTVAESQAGMRKALADIQQALRDLKAASGALSEANATKVEKLLQAAEAEATKSIAIHATEG